MVFKNDKRGIALFLTLGFTAILVMMLAATLTSTHGGNIFSQDYHGKTAALYAAESGLAMVQEELAKNPNWTVGFDEAPTPFGSGKVWVSFEPSGLSVNNLSSMSSPPAFKPGPYGPVAPGTAFIRVEGRAQGQTEVIECVLGRKSEDFLSAAIVATGKIRFDDDIDISGWVSSENLALAEADVISNYDEDAPWGDGTKPVSWSGPSGSPGGDRIAGTVRSASPPSNSISANLQAISSDSLTDQAPVSVENIDIQRAVDIKSSVSRPIPTTPTSPFTGEYFEGGDKTVAGDIVLDDASLYVDGDLKVLGSIRGVGAVYVTGNTTFAGDSTVMSNEDGVVLYSKGNVHLRGFNGTEWMDTVAASHGKSLQWNETKECMRLLTNHLRNFVANPVFTSDAYPGLAPPAPEDPPAPDNDYYWRSDAGLAISVLAFPVADGFRPPGITDSDLLAQMATIVNLEPSSGTEYDTQSFMKKKFEVLYDPTAGPDIERRDALGTNPGTVDASLIQDFQAGDSQGVVRSVGLQVELFLAAAIINGKTMGDSGFSAYAGLTEDQLRKALLKHAHWLEMYDFDRLGESYFQGNIYTRGAIYASNEVTILGSLAAVADPNEPVTGWTPPDRHDSNATGLKPGDVYLGHGTRIVHLGHLKPGLPSATPPVGVVRWLR